MRYFNTEMLTDEDFLNEVCQLHVLENLIKEPRPTFFLNPQGARCWTMLLHPLKVAFTDV